MAATNLTLAVPYQLDFEVRHAPAPLWATGGEVWVYVELVSPVTADAEEAFSSLVTTFVMLASTGAMCGQWIEPWRSTIEDHEAPPGNGHMLSYRFIGCSIDELSTILCVNTLALAHAEFPIARIRIGSPSSASSAVQTIAFDVNRDDPYPGLYGKLPFTCSFDPDQDSPVATITFVNAPDDDIASEIRDQVLTWAAASASGCYATVLAPPQDCWLTFSPDDIELDGEVVTVSIGQLRCHDAALRGLVNACAALHPTLGIRSIEIA